MYLSNECEMNEAADKERSQLDGVLQLWYEHMLQRVDSAVRHLDDLVQDDKGRLQARELDQSLDRFGVDLSRFLDLLPAAAQAGQPKVGRRARFRFGALGHKGGQDDAGHVLLVGFDGEGRFAGGFLDLVRDVAGGVGDLGEREGGELHDAAHLALGFVNLAGDRSKAFR